MISIKYSSGFATVTATPYEFKQALPHVHRVNRTMYTLGIMQPNYPVPSLQGEVIWDYSPNGRNSTLDIVITDCDERADPRLVLTVYNGAVFTDYPHDSPNYR